MFCVSVKVKLSVSLLSRSKLLFHYYVFVCILPVKAFSEMTSTVSGRMVNPTHSLTWSVSVTCTKSQCLHLTKYASSRSIRHYTVTCKSTISELYVNKYVNFN